jgi:hypothetical protein
MALVGVALNAMDWELQDLQEEQEDKEEEEQLGNDILNVLTVSMDHVHL